MWVSHEEMVYILRAVQSQTDVVKLLYIRLNSLKTAFFLVFPQKSMQNEVYVPKIA
jgi:hypothetical protein